MWHNYLNYITEIHVLYGHKYIKIDKQKKDTFTLI